MTLIGFVVALLIIALLFWAVQQILAVLHVGEPIATIVKVVFVLLVAVWLLQWAVLRSPVVRLW